MQVQVQGLAIRCPGNIISAARQAHATTPETNPQSTPPHGNLVLQKGGMESAPKHAFPTEQDSRAENATRQGEPNLLATQSRENHRRRSQKAKQDCHFPCSTGAPKSVDVKSSMETGPRPVLAWEMRESVISLPAHASSRTLDRTGDGGKSSTLHVLTESRTAFVTPRVDFNIVWSMLIPSARRETADLVLIVRC